MHGLHICKCLFIVNFGDYFNATAQFKTVTDQAKLYPDHTFIEMKNIQMVDLKGQYEKIKTEIDKSIQDVINATAFINGPQVKKFSENLGSYLNVKHVIPCANGTDALQIALMALDLKPGDEIITTPFTFIATVEVVELLGLKLVFADVDPNTFNIDPKEIEKKITSNTKAIVPVHLYGQCADMNVIMAIANKYNLFVIEDTAQAIGSDYKLSSGNVKKAGTIGHVGCTSFFPSKNLGCYGDGGALYTNDDSLAEKIRMIVNHGSKIKYYHETIGVNSRLDSMQAAILDVKLKYLDDYIGARQKAAAFYDKAFDKVENIQIPARHSESTHVFHQYTVKLKNVDRNTIQDKLKDKGIPAMIYYPVPLHLQKAYEHLGYKKGDFPVSESLSEIVLSLPMHTEINEEQLSYIADSLIEVIIGQ